VLTLLITNHFEYQSSLTPFHYFAQRSGVKNRLGEVRAGRGYHKQDGVLALAFP